MRKEVRQSQQSGAAAAAQLAPTGFEPQAAVATSHATFTPELIEKIRARAYELWIERGCRDGSAEQDWIAAEAEILSTRNLAA
jgi:hypothetical protein